jgi:hypothetical protein
MVDGLLAGIRGGVIPPIASSALGIMTMMLDMTALMVK